jgi:hypothetical protein
MTGARHGMCKLMRQGNGKGTAWEPHGMRELAFKDVTNMIAQIP